MKEEKKCCMARNCPCYPNCDQMMEDDWKMPESGQMILDRLNMEATELMELAELDEEDLEKLKELYPVRVRQILTEVEKVCDSMEYEGSVMFDELPEKQRPVINPELMLTSLYFLQEMRRPDSEEEKEKADLRAMDEELVANLVRGRFLSGIIVDESEEDAEENTEEVENSDGNTENEKVEDFESDVESKNAEDGKIEESKESETEEEQPKKKKKNNIRVPYVNNQNGEMYQAIFTDGYELQRFDPKKRLRPVVVKFDDLEKFLVKDAKGFLLNPTSTALPLRREQLPAFKKRIDG